MNGNRLARCCSKGLACLAIVLGGAAIVVPAARAQTAPNTGQILRDIQPNAAPPAPTLPAPQALPPEAPLPPNTGTKIKVAAFHIVATQFPQSVLQEVVSKYVGRELTIGEIDEAARQIDEYYRSHDLLARAYLPPQTVKNGVIEIDVLEAHLGKVRVDPSSRTRLDAAIAQGIVTDRTRPGEPLRPSQIQEGTAVLNEIPGVAANSVVAAGAAEGQSDVVLKVQDTPLVTGSAQIDNESATSVGGRRALGNVLVNDGLGYGEQFIATAMKTLDSDYGRLAAAAPAGYSGLTLGVDGSYLKYKVEGPFSAVGAGGAAWTLGGTAAYPLRRSSQLSLTLTSTADYKRLVDYSLQTDTDDKTIFVAGLGISGTEADSFQGGGLTNFAIGATLGHLDLGAFSDATETAGPYSKLTGSISRDQRLADALDLYGSALGQFAPGKNLDSVEQISLGGPNGVRAYPINEASGDDGIIATGELRWAVREQLRLFGFYDFGGIVQHVSPNAATNTGTPNMYTLQGAGIGLAWTPFPFAQIRATLAHTIGENAGRNPVNGTDADGKRYTTRPWLLAVITF